MKNQTIDISRYHSDHSAIGEKCHFGASVIFFTIWVFICYTDKCNAKYSRKLTNKWQQKLGGNTSRNPEKNVTTLEVFFAKSILQTTEVLSFWTLTGFEQHKMVLFLL